MKVHLFCITLALCLIPFVGGAKSIDEKLTEARLYYEAGDFNRAASHYESLLDFPTSPWQQGMIAYDLGTTRLAQEKFDEALKTFQSIQATALDFPLLNDRLRFNEALLQLILAKKKAVIFETNQKRTLDDYSLTRLLLEQATASIKKAFLAHCQLLTAEGANQCDPSLELDEMQLVTKLLVVQLLDSLQAFRLSHASLQEGGAALFSNVKTALEQVAFMKQVAVDSQLAKEYLELFRQEQISWQPLWGAVEALVNEESGKEIQNVFHQAKSAYELGVKKMKESYYPAAKQAFSKSIKALNAFLDDGASKKSVSDVIKKTLIQYDLTLSQEPIRHASLQALIEVQSLLELSLIQQTVDEIQDDYHQAKLFLEEALHELEDYQTLQARMFIEEARFQIKTMMHELTVAKKNDPKTMLKWIIKEEENALMINRLAESVKPGETLSSKTQDLVQRAQGRPLELTKLFYQAVIKKQRESTSESDAIAWTEVVPLFAKGETMARQAMKLLLHPDTERRAKASQLQEKAGSLWKEALVHMQKKKKSDIKQNEHQTLPKQETPPQPQKKAEMKPRGQSVNQVLRLLQEMENDDRSRPRLMETSSKRDVERPW